MPAIAEAFMRLRVDSSVVKKDTERGIDRADTKGSGKRAGTSFGKAFTPEVSKRVGGFSKHVNFKAAGKKGGASFGDGFAAEFGVKTASAIGPSILGLGNKTMLWGLGGTLAGGILPSLLGGLSAGVVAAGGIGTVLLGGKIAIGSKKDKGPLYKAAQQASATFQDAFSKAALPVQNELRKVFKDIPSIMHQLQPGLNALFKGAASLVQPLVKGLTQFAQVALPMLGKAFEAVRPLMQPLIQGLTNIVNGLLPGMINIIKAGAPAVATLSSVLGDIAGALGDALTAMTPALSASSVLFTALGNLFRSLVVTIGQLAGEFAQALGPTFATFARILDGLMPLIVLLGKLIGDIAQAMLHDLNWALQGLLTLFNNIQPALLAFVQAISKAFWVLENSGAFQALGLALVQIVPLLSNLVNMVLNTLTPILPGLIKLMGQVADTLGNILAKALETTLPLLAKIAQTGLQSIAVLLPVILPPLLQFVRIVGDLMAGAARIVIPVLVQLAQQIFGALAIIIPKILPPLLQLARMLSGILLDGLKILLPPLAQIATVLLQALTNVIVAVLPPIAQLAKVLAQSLGKILIAILPSVVKLALALTDLLVALLPIIPPLVQIISILLQLALRILTPVVIPVLVLLVGAVTLVVKAITVFVGWLTGALPRALLAVFRWAKANWPLLLPIFLGPIGLAAAGIIKYWHDIARGAAWLWHQVTGAWDNMKNGVHTAWKWIHDNVLAPMGRFFTKTIPGWFSAAVAAIGGFWDGLKKTISEPVYAVAHGVLSPLAGGLAKVLGWVGIHLNVKPLNDFINRIPHWRTGGRLPGYGGGDRRLIMAEDGETVVSKEASRLPYMQAAFRAAGVPGYQAGGVIGSVTGWLKSVPGVGALLSGGLKLADIISKAALSGLKTIFGLRGKATSILGNGMWADALRKIPGWLIGQVLGFLKPKATGHYAKANLAQFGPAFTGAVSGAVSAIMAWTQKYMKSAYGWGADQWPALRALWMGESGWNYRAYNASSGATGIPQSLPGSKMAAAGADWRTNPATQVRWGLGYIKAVYGSPVYAYRSWLSRSPHWYRKGGKVRSFDQGGTLPENIFGIGSSGTRYKLHAGENVTSAGRSPVQINIPQVVVRETADINLLAQKLGAMIAASGLG